MQYDFVTEKNMLMHAITLIRSYVSLNTKSGFNDAAKALEPLFQEIFKVTRGLDLKNANITCSSTPAIDLVDDNKKVAVQVTTTANKNKVSKTKKTYEDYEDTFAQHYDELVIVGFCKKANSKDYPRQTNNNTKIEVLGLEDIINQISTSEVQKIRDFREILNKNFPQFHQCHAYQDIDCFKVIMRFVNRDALKHPNTCEGSFDDKKKALKEIKQLLTAGYADGHPYVLKPLTSYSDEYQEILDNMNNKIGSMIKILNNKNFPVQNSLSELDLIQMDFIKEANNFSTLKKIGVFIENP